MKIQVSKGIRWGKKSKSVCARREPKYWRYWSSNSLEAATPLCSSSARFLGLEWCWCLSFVLSGSARQRDLRFQANATTC